MSSACGARRYLEQTHHGRALVFDRGCHLNDNRVGARLKQTNQSAWLYVSVQVSCCNVAIITWTPTKHKDGLRWYKMVFRRLSWSKRWTKMVKAVLYHLNPSLCFVGVMIRHTLATLKFSNSINTKIIKVLNWSHSLATLTVMTGHKVLQSY